VQEFRQRRDNYVHDSYLGDRSYRLAKAVMAGRTVESQDLMLRWPNRSACLMRRA
jgi:hypothetical protein